jgi:hypothetical protein
MRGLLGEVVFVLPEGVAPSADQLENEPPQSVATSLHISFPTLSDRKSNALQRVRILDSLG